MSWWERQWYKLLSGAVTVGGALRAASLTVDNLTSGRVPVAGTGGLLGDDGDLTFATDTLSATNVTSSGTVQAGVLKQTTLTAGRIPVVGAGGAFGDDSDLTFTTDTLSATNVTSSGTVEAGILKQTTLTAGRVPFVGAGGALGDDADMTFTTNTFTATIVSGGTVKSTTAAKLGDGGSTNYTNFDDTGHQTMVGTAKPWEDLRIEPVARTTGANAPTFEQWRTDGAGSRGVYLYSFDDATAGSEKEVFFTMQMPHAWDGLSIEMHVHWIGNVADTTSAPRWGLEYTWRDLGGAVGTTTIVYSDGVNYVSGSTNDDITAFRHYISKFAALDPGTTANDLSSILIGRLFRDSANAADTYNAATNKCGLMYIDAHYQISSIGSTDEYTK